MTALLAPPGQSGSGQSSGVDEIATAPTEGAMSEQATEENPQNFVTPPGSMLSAEWLEPPAAPSRVERTLPYQNVEKKPKPSLPPSPGTLSGYGTSPCSSEGDRDPYPVTESYETPRDKLERLMAQRTVAHRPWQSPSVLPSEFRK